MTLTHQAATQGRTAFEQTHEVETPEQVVISYTIAGLGSRLFAGLFDALLAFVVLAGVWVLIFATIPKGIRPDVSAGWAIAILYLSSFVVFWGYHVLFEGLADGRTPGKRLLGLRVVEEDGLSVSFGSSAVRNLFRLIDLQPFPIPLVAMVSIAISRLGKRIGDTAGGTIVVRERPAHLRAHGVEPPRPRSGALLPRLTDAEFSLLARYIARRTDLPPAERSRIASLVAERLRRYFDQPSGADAAKLLRLYETESAARASTIAARTDREGGGEKHAIVVHAKPRWLEFAAILERAQRRSLSRLPEEEISDFAARYREIAADLARLKTASRGSSIDELFYVARLVAAGHNLLYRHARPRLQRAARFVLVDSPHEVGRSIWWILASAALFLAPAVISHIGVVRDSHVAADILPPELLERADQAAATPSRGYVELPEPFRPVVASAIIANNVQVAIGSYVFGITAGVGTLFLLVYNGITIGAVSGLYTAKGVAPILYGFVAPHGVLEIAAIAISGGAGLMVGAAMLVPGTRTRREAIVDHARRAVALIPATVLLLAIAGTIEGLVSPKPEWSLGVKLAVSAATAVALVIYLLAGYRLACAGGNRPTARPVP